MFPSLRITRQLRILDKYAGFQHVIPIDAIAL